MTDVLMELSRNPAARRAIKSLGLPLPLPQSLARAKGPYQEQPLQDRIVVVGGSATALSQVLAETLVSAGAEPFVDGDEATLAAFAEAGEAYGRPATKVNGQAETLEAHAVVFDASAIRSIDELRSVYDFFHPWVRRITRSGRLVILGRSSHDSPEAGAAQYALEGFVRSIAKEIGKQGSTAALVTVGEGAEARLPGVLRYVLSPRSAFVSGQRIDVTAAVRTSAGPRWTHPLEGKVALVTGAARGIGKATAQLMAAEGAHVVCLDRPQDDGPVSQVARSVGGSVLLCDVSSADAPAVIADGLSERGVDIVVHNAGITRDKTLARMKPELWDQTLSINLDAVAQITRSLVDGPLRNDGRIICLSSVAGIAGNMGQTNYAASKAGVIGLVRQWAPALADRGITVNAVAPGFIETRLTAAIPVVIREVGRRLSALGQGGMPRDVGDLITFLSTPGSSGITGSVIRVCGGAFIGA